MSASIRTTVLTASLGVIGMSHRTASLADIGASSLRSVDVVRETFSGIGEYVMLATCNRIEVYFLTTSPQPARTVAKIRARIGTNGKALFSHTGPAALRHLREVASGIDSLVVGETEILAQVRTAAREARRSGTCGPQLAAIFDDAFRFGRDIRRKVPVSAGAGSVAELAVDEALAGRSLTDTRVLLYGAGETATKVALRLMKHPPAITYITNRTVSRARALEAAMLAAHPGARVEVVPTSALPMTLSVVQVAIAAVSAPEPVIGTADVPSGRTDLLLVDLGVPANVAPQLHDPSRGITRLTIEDLRPRVDATLAARKKWVPEVRRRIAAETSLLTVTR